MSGREDDFWPWDEWRFVGGDESEEVDQNLKEEMNWGMKIVVNFEFTVVYAFYLFICLI